MKKPNLYILTPSTPSKEPKKKKGLRKDGLVATYGSYGKDASGKRVRKAFYGKTMKEAEAEKDAYEKKLGLGVSPEDMVINVADWSDRWLKVYKPDLKGRNRDTYIYAIKKIKKAIGHVMVKDVTEIMLQSFLNTFAGMSDSYIAKMRFIMKNIFHRAQKNKIIDDNPASDLKCPAGESGSHRALTQEEIQLISNNYLYYRFGLTMMLMLYLGLRRGEVSALQWKHVDLDNGIVSVEETAVYYENKTSVKKGAKTEAGVRMIPICQKLSTALRSVPEGERTGYVCTSAKGKLHNAASFRKALESFNKQIEFIRNGFGPTWEHLQPGDRKKINELKAKGEWKSVEIRAHDLRHTFATALYEAGVDVKSSQYYLGHKDVKTTMGIYTHLSEGKKAEARASMTTFLDKWAESSNGNTNEPITENVTANLLPTK